MQDYTPFVWQWEMLSTRNILTYFGFNVIIRDKKLFANPMGGIMFDLDAYRDFDVPFVGKASFKVEVRMKMRMVYHAFRPDFNETLQAFSRRQIAEVIFLDWSNLEKLPPKTCSLLKQSGRGMIRKMLPELTKLIDWDNIVLRSIVLGEPERFREFCNKTGQEDRKERPA